MNQKEIRVCLSKIYNWQESTKICPLLIQFFSKRNESLIAKKAVKATLMNNYLQIGIHLKIKYSQNQNEMIVVLERADFDGRPLSLVGEVHINLDEVLLRKIKYFPLDDMDKVLQVEVSETSVPKSENTQNQNKNEATKKRNEQFLQERRKFLENVNQTQKMLKRTFSEKIMSLLNQKSHEQGQQYSGMQSNHPPTHLIDQSKVPADYDSIQSGDIESKDLNRKLVKCTSEYGMKFGRKSNREEITETQQPQLQTNNRSTHSQNPKLFLNSLNIVPPNKRY